MRHILKEESGMENNGITIRGKNKYARVSVHVILPNPGTLKNPLEDYYFFIHN